MVVKKKQNPAPSLLVELGTEELPPKALSRLSVALGENLYKGLQEAALIPDGCDDYAIYATPRRLAVKLPAVLSRQPDREQERRGPALQAAFDDEGKPTKAALGCSPYFFRWVSCIFRGSLIVSHPELISEKPEHFIAVCM